MPNHQVYLRFVAWSWLGLGGVNLCLTTNLYLISVRLESPILFEPKKEGILVEVELRLLEPFLEMRLFQPKFKSGRVHRLFQPKFKSGTLPILA